MTSTTVSIFVPSRRLHQPRPDVLIEVGLPEHAGISKDVSKSGQAEDFVDGSSPNLVSCSFLVPTILTPHQLFTM